MPIGFVVGHHNQQNPPQNVVLCTAAVALNPDQEANRPMHQEKSPQDRPTGPGGRLNPCHTHECNHRSRIQCGGDPGESQRGRHRHGSQNTTIRSSTTLHFVTGNATIEVAPCTS